MPPYSPETNAVHSSQAALPVLGLNTAKCPHPLLLAVIIVLLTLLVYLPAIRAGYVWDDDLHLLESVALKDHGLYRTWFTNESFEYYPVTWTSYWLEHQLWGQDPMGYHVVNVLIHAVSALLIWRILIHLGIPGAWLAALIFALHPVNVESVAWIAQRKNTLSMLFFLSAVWSYLRYEDDDNRRYYCLSVLLFFLAMLSKSAAVTLPAVLLFCAWWRRGSIGRRDVVATSVFFAVALVMSVIEIYSQSMMVATGEVVRADGLWARLAGAGWVVWFYLYKTVVPFGLTFVYPRWLIDPAQWFSYAPDVMLLALLVFLWRIGGSFGRSALVALVYFLITVGPAVGFVDFYYLKYSFVGDHYQYFSLIGVIALFIALGAHVSGRTGHVGIALARALGIALVTVCGLLTWQQSSQYKNEITLWHDTIEKNPDAWLAHGNLGMELMNRRDLDLAVLHLRRAYHLRPRSPMVRSNLGAALTQQGKHTEAMGHLRAALERRPDMPVVHNNLGIVLIHLGKLDDAVTHLQEAIITAPDFDDAHNNLGMALMRQGKYEEAIAQFNDALRINPQHRAARENLNFAGKMLVGSMNGKP